MKVKKFKIGDIRPIYNVTGFQVCKTSTDNPEEAEWTPVEKISEAEILSFVYQQTWGISESSTPSISKVKNQKTKKPKKIELDNKEINNEIEELQKKLKRLKGDEGDEEINDEEITDEEL